MYVLEKIKGNLKELAIHITEGGKKILKNAACKLYLKLGCLLPLSLRSPYILKIYQQAIKRYVPEVYPGRLIIFKAAGDSRDPRSWERLAAGGLEVVDVPGDHLNVLNEPHVQLWAEELKSCFQSANDNKVCDSGEGNN